MPGSEGVGFHSVRFGAWRGCPVLIHGVGGDGTGAYIGQCSVPPCSRALGFRVWTAPFAVVFSLSRSILSLNAFRNVSLGPFKRIMSEPSSRAYGSAMLSTSRTASNSLMKE